MEAMLNMREGEEYGSDSTTPLIDVNLLDDQGLTALHCAASNGLYDTCKVQLEQHADPNRTQATHRCTSPAKADTSQRSSCS